MDARSLVGVWKLVSLHMTDNEGDLTYAFDRDAVGYYVFTPSGYGSVPLMKKDRRAFNSSGIFGGSADEFIEAGRSYISYARRYEVRGEQFVPHAEVAFFPNWVGGERERGTRYLLFSLPVGFLERPWITTRANSSTTAMATRAGRSRGRPAKRTHVRKSCTGATNGSVTV